MVDSVAHRQDTSGDWAKVDPRNHEKGLTGIPRRIHCTATQSATGQDELDRITVDAFLDTLAEVALAVASRIRRQGGVEK